jgi:hypothetical protein
MAVITEVGDGNNTLFWQDRWIDGKSINDLGPLITALIPTRVAGKRTVHEALDNMRWVTDIHGTVWLQLILQLLELCQLLEGVSLRAGVPDRNIWRLSSSGNYSAKSSYNAMFQGSTYFEAWQHIWKTWAPNKCRFFIWLMAQNHCWTADRLARRNLPHPGQYPLCDQEGETINHLLTTCVFARQFWSLLLQQVGITGVSPQPHETTFEDWWRRVISLVSANIRGG